MLYKSLTALATMSLLMPALSHAGDMDTGSVPATPSQMEVLKEVPDSVTNRKPEARGMMAEEMPVSPLQGQVTRELEERFNYLDIDRNGQISRSEGGNNPELEAQWDRLDNNDDGKLDRAEFSAFESTQ